AAVAKQQAKAHLLSNDCRERVVECAERSTCGRPGSVTCCRTDSKGHTRCSIKTSEGDCQAPTGGSVCMSSFASCCTGCVHGGCAEEPVQCCLPPESQSAFRALHDDGGDHGGGDGHQGDDGEEPSPSHGDDGDDDHEPSPSQNPLQCQLVMPMD